ncbi:hypothetical protein PGQ11_002179 [Apiospora arundinis]|uniref:Uncharacterized protein n=1 Tax=Apiospora arundinis TaxID=335852 RepID=A0ABR2JI00_9PEZI
MKSAFMIISAFLLAIQAQAGYSYESVGGPDVPTTSSSPFISLSSASDVESVGTPEVTATSSTLSISLCSASEVVSPASDTSLPFSSSFTPTFARHTTVTKHHTMEPHIPEHHTMSHHRPSYSWSFNGTLPHPLPTGGSVTHCHSHHKSSKGTPTTKQPAHSKDTGPITFAGITIDLPWETVTLEPTTWTPPTTTETSFTVMPGEGAPPGHVPEPLHTKRDGGADPVAQKKVKRDDDPSTLDVPTTFITLKTTVVSQNSTQQHHKTRPLMPKPVVTKKPHEEGGDDQRTKQPLLPKPVVPTHKDAKVKRTGVSSSPACTTSSSGTTWATASPFSLHCDSSVCKTYCYCDQDGHVLCSYDPAGCVQTCDCRAD